GAWLRDGEGGELLDRDLVLWLGLLDELLLGLWRELRLLVLLGKGGDWWGRDGRLGRWSVAAKTGASVVRMQGACGGVRLQLLRLRNGELRSDTSCLVG